MQSVSKILIAVVALAAIIGIGILVGGFGGSGNKIQPIVEIPSNEHSPVKPLANPNAAQITTESRIKPPPRTIIGAQSVPDSASVITNWEEKVDEILGAETDETNKVTQLFTLFPHVPDDAKPEIVQHLSNLTSDENYAPLAELLRNPQLPEPALDVL